jgi:hypothetical protein
MLATVSLLRDRCVCRWWSWVAEESGGSHGFRLVGRDRRFLMAAGMRVWLPVDGWAMGSVRAARSSGCVTPMWRFRCRDRALAPATATALGSPAGWWSARPGVRAVGDG